MYFRSSELVEQLVSLSDVDDVLLVDVVLVPSLLEVSRYVVLNLVGSFQVPEFLQNLWGNLKSLVLGDHLNTVVAVLRILVEKILEELIVLGSVQLVLGKVSTTSD